MPKHTALVLEQNSEKHVAEAVVRMLARHDYKCLCGFDEDQVRSLTEERDPDIQDQIQHADLALHDRSSLITGVSELIGEFGSIELLVIHANHRLNREIAEVQPDDWSALLERNLLGPFHAIQELAPHMKGGRNRQMIFILPGGGKNVREENDFLTATSSGALKRLVETISQELFPEITVNAVRPGSVAQRSGDTEVRNRQKGSDPFQRDLRPEDVAEAVLYLARRSQKITGKTLDLDSGMKFS